MVLDFVTKEDSKIALSKDRVILLPWLEAWRQQGGEKPPTVRRTESPPAGRKGTFDKAERVESAFALLSQKVTKAMRRFRRSLPDREKGKFIEADNQRYDRERLCQP